MPRSYSDELYQNKESLIMPDNTNSRKETTKNRDANPDPITGAPGSHPVGTGIGAAAGGAAGVAGGMAAGAAAGTAGAGPIGGAVGAAVGAVVGGLAGKGVAEHGVVVLRSNVGGCSRRSVNRPTGWQYC